MSHNARSTAEESTTSESVAAHAKRALCAGVRGRITAFLDSGIALLQKLRQKACGAQAAEESEDRPRRDRPRERQESAAPAAEAPKPKRRLRTFLVYVGVMLAGSVGGGVLAYNQFQKQLGQHIAERLRLEAALAEKTRPNAEILDTFEQEQARRVEAEKTLASAFANFTRSTAESYSVLETLVGQQIAESRQALAEAEAQRAEAEAQPAPTLDDQVKSTIESRKPLDAAEKSPAESAPVEETRRSRRPPPVSRRSASSSPPPPGSGDCTLETNNVDSLQKCLKDFNR